jgi:selenocysteine lyase/cysteine desulfurase
MQPGDEIILTRMDHDANVQPWVLLARDLGLEVKWLPFDLDSFEFDLSLLDDLLSDKTKLVCVGGASNLTGTINDVKTISRKARDAGAWTYVDAVQSVPHVSTDVQDLGCDFLVCSAYKFFGPHQGILWGRREVLEALEAYKVRPAPDEIPGSFETGTQSHEGMAGTTASPRCARRIGVPVRLRNRPGDSADRRTAAIARRTGPGNHGKRRHGPAGSHGVVYRRRRPTGNDCRVFGKKEHIRLEWPQLCSRARHGPAPQSERCIEIESRPVTRNKGSYSMS